MVTMQQEVSKNNYIPVDTYTMYEGILKGIASDMNYHTDENGNWVEDDDIFVLGYDLNYNHECSASYKQAMESLGLVVSPKLNTPADYGDVAVIELTVYVNTPVWYYDRSQDGASDSTQRRYVTNELTYVYQVPCLRYISVTQ